MAVVLPYRSIGWKATAPLLSPKPIGRSPQLVRGWSRPVLVVGVYESSVSAARLMKLPTVRP